MRILLTGANGQVGWELSNRGGQQGFEVLALDRADLDITDPVSVSKEVNRSAVSLVVNAAGYTAVDEAESEPELAFAANRDGPSYLASACGESGGEGTSERAFHPSHRLGLWSSWTQFCQDHAALRP
jgi:dTDP-4-dehydrorhamnose reductase